MLYHQCCWYPKGAILISLNMSAGAHAVPQASLIHVDVAQALAGNIFSQMRVSGKTSGGHEFRNH